MFYSPFFRGRRLSHDPNVPTRSDHRETLTIILLDRVSFPTGKTDSNEAAPRCGKRVEYHFSRNPISSFLIETKVGNYDHRRIHINFGEKVTKPPARWILVPAYQEELNHETFTILHSNDIQAACIGMGSDLEVICFSRTGRLSHCFAGDYYPRR